MDTLQQAVKDRKIKSDDIKMLTTIYRPEK